MNEVHYLNRQLKLMSDDPRLSPCHVSLYMSLFHHWISNNFIEPIRIQRGEVMHFAKINGIATYHRCMKDLSNYGYIRYQPSYNPAGRTKVLMLIQSIKVQS